MKLLGLLMVATLALAVKISSTFNASCGSVYIHPDSSVYFSDDLLFLSARSQYSSAYSLNMNSYAYNLTSKTCTSYSYPSHPLDTFGTDVDDLYGSKVGYSQDFIGTKSYSSGVWTFEGGGDDIWNTDDEFYWGYREVKGSAMITGKTIELDYYEGWSKFGLMVRNTLHPNSKFTMLIVAESAANIAAQWRTNDGGGCDWTRVVSGSAENYYLRLILMDGDVRAFVSLDGSTWNFEYNYGVSFSTESAMIGVAITAHNSWSGAKATGTMEKIQIDGYVMDHNLTNYFVYITADYSAYPFMYVPQQDKLFRMNSTYDNWILQKSWTGVSNARINTGFTYTSGDQCAWYMYDYDGNLYASLETSISSHTHGSTWYSLVLPEIPAINVYAVDENKGRVYIPLADNSLIIIDADAFVSSYSMEYTQLDNFFFLSNAMVGVVQFESTVLVDYGAIIIGYEFDDTDHTDFSPISLIFSSDGTPRLIQVDNDWRGPIHGEGPAGVFLSVEKTGSSSISINDLAVMDIINSDETLSISTDRLPVQSIHPASPRRNAAYLVGGLYAELCHPTSSNVIGFAFDQFEIVEQTMYNCSNYTSCQDVLTDNLYCGWCLTSMAAQDFTQSCSATPLYRFAQLSGCPEFHGISPSSIPDLTSWNITVTGILYAANVSDLACKVGGIVTNVSQRSDTSMVCEIPPLASGSYNIFLESGGKNYTSENFTLNVFPCNLMENCDECTAIAGCGWEYDKVACGSIEAASGPIAASSSECPVISGAVPSGQSSGTIGGKVNVTVSPFYLPYNGSDFNCTFYEVGGINMSINPAKYINATVVECDIPFVVSSLNVEYYIRIEFTGYARNYTSDYASFLFYTCSNSLTCDDCVDPIAKPGCVWCFDSSTCQSTGACAGFEVPVVCPRITAIDPESSYYAEKTNVSVIGTDFFDMSPFFLRVDYPGGHANVSATYINSSLMYATNIASVTAGYGNLTLYTNASGENIMDVFGDYPFYECTGFKDCESCVGQYERCGWCYETGCQFENNSCPSQMFESICPLLFEIDPAASQKDTQINVTLTGTYFPPGFVYRVHVKEIYIPFEKNGTWCERIDSTHLYCDMPSSGYESDADVYLWINDTLFLTSSIITFKYYRCSDFSDCETCLSLPTCAYCHFGQCLEKEDVASTCANGTHITTCPLLIDASQNASLTSGGDNVTLYGIFGLPYNSSISMTVLCSVNSNHFEGEVLSNNSVLCIRMPEYSPGFISAPYFKEFNLSVSINSIPLTQMTYEYFDCFGSELNQGCSDCLDRSKSSINCGYCYSSWECTILSNCSDAGSYLDGVCPSLSSANISFTSALLSVPVTLSGVNMPQFSSSATCEWGVNSTAATTLSPTSLRCDSPLDSTQTSLTQSLTLELHIDGKRYADSTLSHSLLNCQANYIPGMLCSSCTAKESRCGWCSNIVNESSACTTVFECQTSLWADTFLVCPSITSISDSIFYTTGGLPITISGTKLFNSTELYCEFSSSVQPLVLETDLFFINSTHSYCMFPPWPLANPDNPEAVDFKVIFEKRSFADSFSASITVLPLPKEGGINPFILILGGSGFGSIVFILIIVIIVIVIVFIVVLLVVVYLMSRGGRRKLKKPNFKEVAFGLDDKQKYNPTTRSVRALRYMEDIILEYEDTEFLSEVVKHVLPEEVDLFTKHLIYIILPLGHAKVLDVILAFFALELEISENETTLFRVNSITTKMFARYARIVGAEWLWTALAYFVDEIIFKYSQKNEEKDEFGDVAMTSVSMELDPTKVSDGDVDFLAANTYQLLLTLTNLYRRFTRLSSQFPPELSFFLKQVYEGVSRKYPGAEYKSVGGFVFLRWICPAIFSPHAFGVSTKPPGSEAGRMLVLIAKTVQNISNETYPGRKEDFMGKVDEFIKANIPVCHKFVDAIMDASSSTLFELDQLSAAVEVPKNAYTNSLIWFHNFLLTKPSFIESFPDLQLLFGKYSEPIL